MKISLRWLSEFVVLKHHDAKKFAQQIAEHCFEVEKIIDSGQQQYRFSNVFVAKVLHWEKHPNADRLRIVRLELAPGSIIEPVVCGANNFDAGDMVALALPGANIPQNVHTGEKIAYTLGQAKIRGIESRGMICSAFELGLTAEPETNPEILLLNKTSSSPGQSLEEYFSAKDKGRDTVFDLALPANRPDLYSHFGIAREFAAILGLKTTTAFSEIEKKYFRPLKSLPGLEAEVQDQHCRIYFAARIKVKVGPSPQFVKNYLEALGLRSINNVVDITNYVLLELGQPLHAFDSAAVAGKIFVRKALPGEKMETLDHKTRALPADTMVIADNAKALAIAGIIGGKNSEVAETTAEIILESANFEPFNIRKTAKLLNIRTESSVLWEKGLHPRQAVLGANRAIELLEKYAAAKVLAVATAGELDLKPQEIKFTVGEVNDLLGTYLSESQVKRMLGNANIEVSGTKNLLAKIPYYRSDVFNYADLADELARIQGLNAIAMQPSNYLRSAAVANQSSALYGLKIELAMLGYTEVQNYSFVSEKDIQGLAAANADTNKYLKVKNPLSADQGYMKRNLLIPLLKNIAANSKNFEHIALFEIGKKYLGMLNEPELLTFVLYDKNQSAELLLAKIKGALHEIIFKHTALGLSAKFKKEGSADLLAGDEIIGSFGIVEREALRNFGIDYPVAFAELELPKLWELKKVKQFENFSRLPQKVLDISLIVKNDIHWEQIERVVRLNSGADLKNIELFEAPHFYSPGSIPKFHRDLAQKGMKNLAFHLIFQSEKETLKDVQIKPLYDKIIAHLKAEFNAEIR